MLKKIIELETIRQEQARLAARETELVTPELTDTDLLPLLYLWFKEYGRRRNCPPARRQCNATQKIPADRYRPLLARHTDRRQTKIWHAGEIPGSIKPEKSHPRIQPGG